MTWRFRRSVKVFPGVHLHIGKRGVGVSIGPRGLHLGVTSQGKAYLSAGIPGTGLSVRKELYGKSSNRRAG